MKRIFTLLSALAFLFVQKGFSQRCVILGCANNFGTQTTDATQTPTVGGLQTCYDSGPFSYTQLFWQFFFVDPSGPQGAFAQQYTPLSGTIPLDLDWAAFDIGTTAPPPFTCPVDASTWTLLACDFSGTHGDNAGPGIDQILNTTSGHYYAIAIIINPTGADPSPGTNFTFDVGAPTLGGTPLGVSNCTPIVLPVTLTSFGANVNSCAVNLSWAATSETAFNNYEVQSSSNGSVFQTIATIPASNQRQQYSYHDNNPSQGKLFYRLKMVDIDNKAEYSKTIAMNLDCNKSQVFVYPNPVKDNLNVNVTNARDNSTTAKLYDHLGRLVYTTRLISGTNSIDMSKMAKGVYMLTILNNSEIQNIKVIK